MPPTTGSQTVAIHPPADPSQATLQIQNTEKRDALIEFEKKYQKEWADAKLFEFEAPTENHADTPKFFGTAAYPYMNGTLHAGHAFTMSKIEFSTGFARMQGRRALFPQGFHCSGMPIKSAADKIKREIELFGPRFEGYKESEETTTVKAADPQAKTDLGKFGGSKSKAVAKTGAIMAALDIPIDEVAKFADPAYWLTYFPELCREDLTSLGCRIDWRRSMVTTDANPFYDAFVRWQMNRLKELGKVRFGKRYTVYSPKDRQPCLDHDRSAGEGVGVQEYTCVKLRTLEWSERASQIIGDKIPAGASVFFVPATLRPETMYGQTCCFVGPKVKYGVFELSGDKKEYVVATHRAARNMSYQNLSPGWGVTNCILEFVGSDLIGTLVHAPLSTQKDGIRILPMESLKDSKGTAVVTCVPSDSPDDYATTLELTKKPEFYGIKKEWVDREILPIIETPKGNLIAKTLYEELGIQSPKDAKQLAEAKEVAYKNGFYQGTMIYGEFAGKSVPEARDLVTKQLVDQGLAFRYAEPDGLVISRSGDECIAAYLDQWYFNYGTAANGGDAEWNQTVTDYLKNEFDCYFPEAKHAFEQALGWLAHWACSRSFGLGTKLPWDSSQLVESLSDSTVYMAYYTICHLLHSDIYGKTPGLSKKPITPEQMTDQVWDYIFFRVDEVDTDISEEDLASMRNAFSYWYPMDIRVSGKDLITNHLTFNLYHHIALFPKKFWPRSFRVNGHLMLNGSKMSKSTGNFLTLRQAIDKFGADATRLSLAEAGDGIEDANLEETVANAAILRLYELRKWSKDVLEDESLRTGESGFFDKLFDNDLKALVIETRGHYERTSYKLAMKSGFYDLQSARDSYRENCKAAGIGMHRNLVKQFIELQALLITPIAPHWAEYVWREILGKDSSIQNALFPTVSTPDPVLLAVRDYIKNTAGNIQQAESRQLKKMSKGKQSSFDPTKNKKLTIFVAESFPAWQNSYRSIMQEHYEATGNTDLKAVMSKIDKKEMKKVMPFLQNLKKRLDGGESADRVFEKESPFKEVEVLREMVPGLQSTVRKLEVVEAVRLREDGKGEVVFALGKEEAVAKFGSKAGDVVDGVTSDVTPGNPASVFVNIDME
ncbi:leucyl-tRNA synthetase [Plectosphaerella plurivora]|uniref:leucine--tRNA ligase n=1 Tax=Plectosphaerella plurivora TaxID=936078 RepID=A0A9P8VCG0_9PEZI|nr:leucyl-tRNA synthetase [Plectosphaerella plurivora]